MFCISTEWKIKHFHYMTYIATPQFKTPCPASHEIYNFYRPFLGHYYYIVSLNDLWLGVEKKIFRKIMQFSQNDLYGHDPAQDP